MKILLSRNCLEKWLAAMVFVLACDVFAGSGIPEADGTFCNVNTTGSSISYDHTNSEGILSLANIIGMPPPSTPVPILFVSSSTEMPFDYVSFSLLPPAIGDLAPALDAPASREPTLSSGSSAIVYLVAGAGPGGESCAFSYLLTYDGAEYSRSGLTLFDRSGLTNAKNLPLFDPIGLFLCILGLVYYSRRQFEGH